MTKWDQVVAVDIDGVLADFEGFFCDVYGYADRHMVKLEDRYPERDYEIKEFVSNPKTYRLLQPIDLGLEIVQWLNNHGYEVAIVSSRPNTSYAITRAWLKDFNVPFTFLYVGNYADKTEEIARLKPIVAIDDLGQVAEKLKKFDILTILFAWPWNRDFIGKFPRISQFSDFLSQFSRILEDSKKWQKMNV